MPLLFVPEFSYAYSVFLPEFSDNLTSLQIIIINYHVKYVAFCQNSTFTWLVLCSIDAETQVSYSRW